MRLLFFYDLWTLRQNMSQQQQFVVRFGEPPQHQLNEMLINVK